MDIMVDMSGSAPSPSTLSTDAIVIRPAYPDDAAALARLAALDSRRPLTGSALIAERDGRLLAALGTADGRAVADPFARTADLVALLRMRAADTATQSGRPRELLRRVRANPRSRLALARG